MISRKKAIDIVQAASKIDGVPKKWDLAVVGIGIYNSKDFVLEFRCLSSFTAVKPKLIGNKWNIFREWLEKEYKPAKKRKRSSAKKASHI